MSEKNKERKLLLLEAIEQNAGHALISGTLDGIITSFNKAAENMLGYKAEELVEKKTPAVFHDSNEVVERSKLFSKKLGRHIEPGFETFVCHCDAGLPNQFEWIYIHKSGRKFPVLLTISTLYDHEGCKFGYLGIAQDISKLREKEHQLSVANKKLLKSNDKLALANEELTQFSYRTSHDLKAPLTTSKKLSEFAIKDIEEGKYSEALKNIHKIKCQAERLETLVSDILSLARADFEASSYQKLDFQSLIADIKEDLGWMIPSKNFIIKKNVCVNKDFWGDKSRIYQALGNLISNAIKYRNPEKTQPYVSIDISEKENHLQIIVSDNGLGIPENCIKDLFKMFKRFHPNVATGSGLGLSIVKKNVERMNGTITVESSCDGTSFKINIPYGENNA